MQIMNFKDIKDGEIFTIDETPSYPKLKTNYGYIDMREKVKRQIKTLNADIRIMTIDELYKQFNTTENEIFLWKQRIIDEN